MRQEINDGLGTGVKFDLGEPFSDLKFFEYREKDDYILGIAQYKNRCEAIFATPFRVDPKTIILASNALNYIGINKNIEEIIDCFKSKKNIDFNFGLLVPGFTSNLKPTIYDPDEMTDHQRKTCSNLTLKFNRPYESTAAEQIKSFFVSQIPYAVALTIPSLYFGPIGLIAELFLVATGMWEGITFADGLNLNFSHVISNSKIFRKPLYKNSKFFEEMISIEKELTKVKEEIGSLDSKKQDLEKELITSFDKISPEAKRDIGVVENILKKRENLVVVKSDLEQISDGKNLKKLENEKRNYNYSFYQYFSSLSPFNRSFVIETTLKQGEPYQTTIDFYKNILDIKEKAFDTKKSVETIIKSLGPIEDENSGDKDAA